MDRIQLTDKQVAELLELKAEGWIDPIIEPKDKSYKIEDINMVKLHDYVTINPPHDMDEFTKLLYSLAQFGQLEPIKIWQKNGSKFIIDGRHRYEALKHLDAKYIKYVNIPSNLTKEDIRILVIESENRRKMTPAQNAIRGWKDYTENHKVTGLPISHYGSMYGTSAASISRCNTISKELGSKVLDELFETKKAKLGGKYLKSINQILKHIEDGKEKTVKGKEAPPSVKKIVPLINELVKDDDMEALAYLRKTISHGIAELNKD